MPREPIRDIVRGLTTLEMTAINLSDVSALAHSGYIDHVAYADTIFPTFAFITGMSPSNTKRSIGLVGLGLALNGVSAYAHGSPIRIPGVLQRLGLSSLLIDSPLKDSLSKFYGLPLFLTWYAVSIGLADSGSNPFAHPDYKDADQSKTAQTKIDKALLGSRHLHTPNMDPEGLLGALTTAFTMLAGSTFADSQFFNKRWKVTASLLMIIAGQTVHLLMPCYAPISKALWTPSFALITTGWAMLKYMAIAAAIPHLPMRLVQVFEATGNRSLEIYLISTLFNLFVKYGGVRSIWARSNAALAPRFGVAKADLFLTGGVTAAMAATALFLVRHKLRIAR